MAKKKTKPPRKPVKIPSAKTKRRTERETQRRMAAAATPENQARVRRKISQERKQKDTRH